MRGIVQNAKAWFNDVSILEDAMTETRKPIFSWDYDNRTSHLVVDVSALNGMQPGAEWDLTHTRASSVVLTGWDLEQEVIIVLCDFTVIMTFAAVGQAVEVETLPREPDDAKMLAWIEYTFRQFVDLNLDEEA